MTDRNRNKLDAAKTTFRKSTLYACPTPFFSAMVITARYFTPHVQGTAFRPSRVGRSEDRPLQLMEDASSDVEEELGDGHDVLQVEDPAGQHLDRQRHHHQEEEDRHVIPRRSE